jgi:hypothetical protein
MAHETFYTPPGYLAFEDLRKPRTNDAGEPRWGVCLVFDADAQKTDAFRALEREVAKQVEALKKQTRGKGPRHTPFAPAEGKKDDGDYWPGNGEGHVLCRPSTKRAPDDPEWPLGLFGPDNRPLAASAFYRGCQARAKVHVYTRADPKNPSVSLGLDAVQFLQDGERVGSSSSDFADAPPVPGARGPARAAVPDADPNDDGPPERGYTGPTDDDASPF